MTRRGFISLAAVARLARASASDESIARLIERKPGGIEYLCSGRAMPSHCAGRTQNSQFRSGSLAKPFLALAFGESHAFRYPEFDCAGCWLPQGHGRIGIRAGLAQSCNAYFLQLAARTPVEDIARVAQRYGLTMPVEASAEALIGRRGVWRATPAAIALAYGELAARRTEPGVATVYEALRECSLRGTAMGVGAFAAAKTGTAPCAHGRGAGDGLVAAMFPPEAPEFVLVARAHGVPGAECARRMGGFVRAVVSGS